MNDAAALSPADLHALSDPRQLCYVTKDGLLGREEAMRVAAAAHSLQREGRLKPAQMNRGHRGWHNTDYRGDEILWLHLQDTAPALRRLIECVTALACRLDKLDKASEAGPWLCLQTEDISVQLAFYTGNGKGYTRHRDSFVAENNDKPGRALTFIYYLNPDWVCNDGGHLRLHLGGLDAVHSDILEHEVLPAKAPRLAVTCWVKGRPTLSRPLQTQWSSLLSLQHPSSLPQNGSVTLQGQAHGSLSQQAVAISTAPPLQLQESTGEDENATIFVSVPSYRDAECQHTLFDLFRTARKPERLTVGLVWQYCEEQDQHCFERKLPCEWHRQVRTLRMDHRLAAGPCWARHIAQALWAGETYILQIDSHMRFRPGWDTYLIQTLLRCPSDKPILTTYPIGYELPSLCPHDQRPTLLCPDKFDDQGILRQRARRCASIANGPIPSPLWASGFNFARSSVVEEVSYDRHLRYLFFGEEISMAARLWTHGYDFFAPPENVLYHLWRRDYRPTFRETTNVVQERLRAASLERVYGLLTKDVESAAMGPYGLGSNRSLADFERLLGVNFKDRRHVSASGQLAWQGENFFAEDVGGLSAPDVDKHADGNRSSSRRAQLSSLRGKVLEFLR